MGHDSMPRYVGLDVHKDSIAIAVCEHGRGEAKFLRQVANELGQLVKVLEKLGGKEAVFCCYEAGPTGLTLARGLRKEGWDCIVVAPSQVPDRAGNRIKTDRRDAARLAHFLRSGDLTAIHVLDPDTEAIRDLERARDDAKRAERAAQQQLTKFLLRHGRNYEGRTTWNEAHRGWISKQEFAHEAQKRVLADYLAAVDQATSRVGRLTEDMRELSATWDQAPLVTALQAMRGIEMVSAVTLAAEIGDFRRFAKASDFMSFVGLVPSESSSGLTRRRGPITRTGNGHVRRILVEAAQHYSRPPRLSKRVRERGELASAAVREIAWKAQNRLHKRLNKLLGKGMPRSKAIIAAARELAGFVWAIAREEVLLAGSASSSTAI